jgi:hypothetical protein
MLRTFTRITSLVVPLALAACTPGEEDGNADDETGDTGDGDGDGDGDPAVEPCDPVVEALDESGCMVLPTDYVPGADDDYAACISDPGTYELVSEPPGTIARVEAYRDIANLLWNGGTPTSEDFAMARTIFDIEEGLGSRVERREDLHYPEIPMAEWDPGLDPDKQCSNTMLAAAYPDRCVGPSTLLPMVNQAFINGMQGTGDPNVNAATIKGALLWFLYISPYKEAYTCFSAKGADCDSAWAYYTGGAQLDGELLGFAAAVEPSSANTHSRMFDGLLAIRCVRDLYPEEMFPAGMPLPADGQALFDAAWEQLDEASHRALATILRQHAAAQDACGGAATANWTLVGILGQALRREASERDSAASSELDGLYAIAEPTPEDVARVIELIDQVFPCP